jgi:hypothetical protein
MENKRTVLIGTYCPNNTLETFYVTSLSDTIRLCAENNITVIPLFINDIESSVVAKNELLSIALNTECESIVFVDHNMIWSPGSFLEIVNSEYDAVALPCAKKAGTGVRFDLEISQPLNRDANGYIDAGYASTAMFKISHKLITELSDTSVSITNPSGNEVKNVFDINTQFGRFFNESVVVCGKIKELGHTIWLNPTSTCANVAGNIYGADFAASLGQPIVPEEIKTLYA